MKDKIIEIKAEWEAYKQYLQAKYPPEKGCEFEFTCAYHQRIDDLLAFTELEGDKCPDCKNGLMDLGNGNVSDCSTCDGSGLL